MVEGKAIYTVQLSGETIALPSTILELTAQLLRLHKLESNNVLHLYGIEMCSVILL